MAKLKLGMMPVGRMAEYQHHARRADEHIKAAKHDFDQAQNASSGSRMREFYASGSLHATAGEYHLAGMKAVNRSIAPAESLSSRRSIFAQALQASKAGQ